MIKKLLTLLLSAILLFTLAACAAAPAEERPSERTENAPQADTALPSDSEPVSEESTESETESTAENTDVPTTELTDAPAENRDVLTTPIAYMTDSEEEELAQYLFANYVPCCFGVFESPADLTSTALWTSIAALNSVLDPNGGEEAGKLENVQKKIALFYPGSAFQPEEVRMFSQETQTFPAIPITLQEYVFLSSQRSGDTITIYYRDVPADDSEPNQYATTLKKSTENGYFSFVSTRRAGAVG